MNATRIAELVQDLLAERARTLGDYAFSVPTDMMFCDDDNLWHVFVMPDQPVPQRGAFYDVLNEIEETLEKRHGVRTMLVPVTPETQRATHAD